MTFGRCSDRGRARSGWSKWGEGGEGEIESTTTSPPSLLCSNDQKVRRKKGKRKRGKKLPFVSSIINFPITTASNGKR